MNHSDARSNMADYLEGDLDLTRRALLDAHLDACEACSRDFAEMRTTIGLLRSLETPEPPPFLVESVMRRIREGEGRVSLGDRVREFLGTLASPQIALPAGALALGLMLATGSIDPSAITLSDLSDGVRSSPPASQVGALALQRSLTRVRVPQASVSGPPPAVGRVPSVTIKLPTVSSRQLAHAGSTGSTVSARTTRVVQRWPRSPSRHTGASPRDSLSLPVGNPITPGAEMVGASASQLMPASVQHRRSPSPGAGAYSGSAAAFPLDATDAERAARREAELDQRLDHMLTKPRLFSAEFANYSIAEQEIWLRNLALRATELGRGQQVIQQLRGTDDRLALQLATAFAAELRWVDQEERAEMATLSGKSVSGSGRSVSDSRQR